MQVTCDPTQPPTTYDGYQVELWRRIATELGWGDGDWFFTCMDWTPMIDDILSADGKCTMAAAGAQQRGMPFGVQLHSQGVSTCWGLALDTPMPHCMGAESRIASSQHARMCRQLRT